jgi:hypothetical protein
MPEWAVSVPKPVTRDKIASVRSHFSAGFTVQGDEVGLIDMEQLVPVLTELGADLYLQLLNQLGDDGRELLESVAKAANAEGFDPELHAIKRAGRARRTCVIVRRLN